VALSDLILKWLFKSNLTDSTTFENHSTHLFKIIKTTCVYQLRTKQIDWDDEQLWRGYTMLTDLEAVFRSLKSELGMRPLYHRKQGRCYGHVFITALAYQGVQLKQKGHNQSWTSLKDIFEDQRRLTTTFKQKDGLKYKCSHLGVLANDETPPNIWNR
jgi:transposase